MMTKLIHVDGDNKVKLSKIGGRYIKTKFVYSRNAPAYKSQIFANILTLYQSVV